MAEQPITPGDIRVREVTHWQASWTETAPGEDSVWTIQLVLDNGAAEYVIRPTAEDMEVLQNMLRHSPAVFFDRDRQVLMFGNRSVR